MFNKLLKFFFEEVPEDEKVVVDDELKPISIKTPIEKTKPVNETPVQQPLKTTMADIRVEDTPIKPQVKGETINKAKKFNIDLSREEGKTSEPRYHSSKVESKAGYEFTPVISPMFGADEYDEKGIKDELRKVTNIKPKKLNALGTIISPIFGAQELADMEENAQEKIIAEHKTPIVMEDSELPNYSIDEMISDQQEEEEIENGGQATQCSLFGDQESINEEPLYNIDEEL
ncbi:MAG: hypothetical protein RSF69_04855 [Erysipelotrichaceae bacterium]